MDNYICDLPCILVVREGVSKKTGKPYRLTILKISTELGVCELVLNTFGDRAGMMLDIIARKEYHGEHSN